MHSVFSVVQHANIAVYYANIVRCSDVAGQCSLGICPYSRTYCWAISFCIPLQFYYVIAYVKLGFFWEIEAILKFRNKKTGGCHDVEDGEWLYLVGRRGRCYAQARVTEAIRRGLLFTPFYCGDIFHAESNANYVTNPAFDSVSKQPELKFCAVRIEPDNSWVRT